VRNTFAKTIYDLGREDERICVLVADISPAGSMAKFQEEFPDRFINVGVAEQTMIGIAAGLALRGFRPFAYTIATFALYRPFEFVRDDLAYQELDATIVGIGGGVTYNTLGGTHHAQEDVAIASAIPGMRVIAPCDPSEVAAAATFCATQATGPTYLRLAKAGEPDLSTDAVEPFVPGKVRYLRRGDGGTVLFSYGAIMKMVVEVAHALEAQGESVSIVSVHTLKPLDEEGIAQALHSHRRAAVIEEHSPRGGLSGRVKEIALDTAATPTVESFTLKDQFIHLFGSHGDLLRAHGLAPDLILQALAAAPARSG
jgi:transketolase